LSNGNLKENSPNSGNTSTDNNNSNEWRTGYINGNSFHNKEIKYEIINGMAIFEGDIILARNPQEIEKLSPEPKVPGEHEPSVRPSVKPVVRKGDEYRWPRAGIPYIIISTLPNQQCGKDNDLGWKTQLSNGDIAAATEMYGNLTPTVIENADGRLEVFVIGLDNQLYHRWQTAANSNTWSVYTVDNPDGSKQTYDWTPLGLGK